MGVFGFLDCCYFLRHEIFIFINSKFVLGQRLLLVISVDRVFRKNTLTCTVSIQNLPNLKSGFRKFTENWQFRGLFRIRKRS